MNRYSSKVRSLATAALVLLLVSLASAQNGTAVQSVNQAAKDLVAQQDAGLQVDWTGLGRVAGEMVDAKFTNTSGSTIEVTIMPGVVLTDPQGFSQPIMLEDHITFSLKPGESTTVKNMRAYCLDHAKEPPALGQGVDYRVLTDNTPYEEAIKNLWAGLRLDSEGKYKPVLKPLQHRTVVIQRSVWASLGGNNPTTQDKLADDLLNDTQAGGHPFGPDKIDWLAERIWEDVEKTLTAAVAE